MTRKQEIEKMAKVKASHITSDKDMQVAFADALRSGAEWADDHRHWISVEDEYPKEEQLVLACNAKGFFMPAKYSDGIWWFYWNLKSQLLDVVYWMPMPTLPNDYLAEASKEAHRIILEKQPKGGEE